MGSANTVIFAGGARHGHNTDVPGMITALAAAGLSSAGPALILGAGATACSALAAIRGLGAREATVAVRDPARADGLRAAAPADSADRPARRFRSCLCSSTAGTC